VREREIEIGGVSLPEVGYGWADLEALASMDMEEKAPGLL
jgi:hypothetical protein